MHFGYAPLKWNYANCAISNVENGIKSQHLTFRRHNRTIVRCCFFDESCDLPSAWRRKQRDWAPERPAKARVEDLRMPLGEAIMSGSFEVYIR